MEIWRSVACRKTAIVAISGITAIFLAVFAASAGAASLIVPKAAQAPVITPHAAAPTPPTAAPATSTPPATPPASSAPPPTQSSGSGAPQSSAPASGAVPTSSGEASLPGSDVPNAPGDPQYPSLPPHGSTACIDTDGCQQAWLDYIEARQHAVYVESLATQDPNMRQDSKDLGKIADEIKDEMKSVGQTPVDNLNVPTQQMPSATPQVSTWDAAANVGQDIGQFLTGADDSSTVTASSLVTAAFELLLTGTTACSKAPGPNGRPAYCPS